MANAFKQSQDVKKKENLIAQCKAQIAQGTVGRRRAIDAYMKATGETQLQAEAVLGLR